MSLFKASSEDKLNKKFVVAKYFAELVSKGKRFCLFSKVSDFVSPGGWGISGNIAGNLTEFFQKTQMSGCLPGGRWAVLELTGTLCNPSTVSNSPSLNVFRRGYVNTEKVLYKMTLLNIK